LRSNSIKKVSAVNIKYISWLKTILNTSNLTYSRLYSFLFLVIRVYFFIKGYLAIEWAPEPPVKLEPIKKYVKGILFSCEGACLIAKKVGNGCIFVLFESFLYFSFANNVRKRANQKF
jgi:hypothetical protein